MRVEYLLIGALCLGLVAGVLGGMFGIGGGLIMVPAMILIFQFSTKDATATSLIAQLLPVGVLGVIEYHRAGHVRFGFGLTMALGLFIGIFLGSKIAGPISGATMKRFYGIFLLACSLYFLFAPGGVKSKSEPSTAAPTNPGLPSPNQDLDVESDSGSPSPLESKD